MQTAAMARGLRIINSDQDIGPDIPIDDHIIVNAQRLTDHQPVVEHPLPSQSDPSTLASNASVDHNANSHLTESSRPTDEMDESHLSDIIADYGDAHTESYISYLNPRPPLPSLRETQTAGQILFTQFCRQHLPAGTPLEIMDDAIPEQIESDVNQLLQ